MNENLHTFVNPKSYWQHQGPFSVELTDDADKSIAPATVKFEGNVAHVEWVCQTNSGSHPDLCKRKTLLLGLRLHQSHTRW